MTNETNGTTGSQDETSQLEDALENDQASHGGHPETAGQDNDQGAGDSAVIAEPAAAKAQAASDNEGDQAKKPATPTPPRKLSGAAKAQHEAKAAREKRLQEAQEQLEPPTPPSDAELQELERKAGLQEELTAIAEGIQKHEDGIEELKTRARTVMAELYPATVGSDKHVDAVRGYLKASQEERRNRGAHPARLKELLERAGKAPIDAAFQRARARGQGRPTRSPVGQGKSPGQGEQAKDATPGAQE